MIDGFRTYRRYVVFLLTLILVLSVFVVAYAANISGTDRWAWGTNIGWLNFDDSNSGGVTVYTNHLEGYIWAENIGWIRLNSDGGGSSPDYYANTTASNYGINYNNSIGQLSGYAWGASVGWINFNPTDGGVTINTSTGEFSGYAWGENVGWIKFAGTAQDAIAYKVQTASPTAVTLSRFGTSTGNSQAYQIVILLVLVSGLILLAKRVKLGK